ncbi:MAG TPA: deoxynucleoside kinase [Roseiflexaceae bacterium]|nr:deoxynucleoside kinase [Roseiflexaceae bacterium]
MVSSPVPWLAIEGPIGVGKTTLALLTGASLNADLILEQFEENPFLALFYDNPERYALQTQLYFLLDRFDQLTELGPATRPRVSDYMFAKDRIFAELILADDVLRRYRKVYSALAPQTPPVSHVVYLRTDVDTLLDRIARRSRSYEQTIAPDYLERLTAGYDAFFGNYTATPLLRVDTTDIDLVASAADRAALLQAIDELLAE